jgi:catalase
VNTKASKPEESMKDARKMTKHSPETPQSAELHQSAGKDVPVLTTQQGTPVSDDQNTLSIGPRGPALLEDLHFREKIFHFDHERIPERVVHARGYGAHGYFENYESLADVTRADLFQRAGERTPAFVRFSTVAGNKGSADLARDVRGFAVKLYTQQGNWDIVGNNIPVFFIQDAIKFPDLIHAAKAEPDRDFPQAQTAHDNFWDFISLMPESMHMVMWIMSDRAIPRSFRFMEGFGVHTFRLVNAEGKSTFVKFHWKPKLGLQSVVWNEAVKINGADPDFHRRDLWNAIQSGNFPEWELGLQLFDDAFAEKFAFDVLDATKFIPEEEVPIRKVGRLVLDRCVDNFFAETEQVAFCTNNVVPGIDFSNDPLLQGRNFSYLDTQVKRLGGPNFTHIPINAPKCPFHHFQQDGHMAMQNPQGRVNYEPNSRGAAGGPREDPNLGFRFELSKVEEPAISERMVSHLPNIDEGLAENVATGLGLKGKIKAAVPAVTVRSDLGKSKPLSIVLNPPESFAGRKVGALVTDGVDAKLIAALRKGLEAEGATLEIIAPTVGGVQMSDGKPLKADHKFGGGPSVLFDAVAILTAADSTKALLQNAAIGDFIRDAFGHLKIIGYTETALPLFEKAGIADALDEACVQLDGSKSIDNFIAACRKLRFWKREETVSF